MNHSLDATRYSRTTWVVAALLAVVLAVLWASGRGPADGACCGRARAMRPPQWRRR